MKASLSYSDRSGLRDTARTGRRWSGPDDLGWFDAAPVSLWLQDFSAVKRAFNSWRDQGVTSLKDHFASAPDRLQRCLAAIRVRKVNHKTLTLLEASDPGQLLGGLAGIWGAGPDIGFIDGLEQLWAGAAEFATRVEGITLRGRPIVLDVRGTVMPGSELTWDRVIMATTDVTEEVAMKGRLLVKEAYSRGLFDHSPVSLWLEDGSRLLALFKSWRAEGVVSLHEHLREEPGRIGQCVAAVGIIEVNRKTLSLFEADDFDHLVSNLAVIFGQHAIADMMSSFESLWSGNTEFTCNTVNHTLTGRSLDVQIWGRILPGYEHNWERVLLVIEDVTERESARREAGLSEAHARRLFDHSPVALAVEDYSYVKSVLDALRTEGVEDLEAVLDRDPEMVDRCAENIRVVDVNHLALELFKAPGRDALDRATGTVLGEEGRIGLRAALLEMWRGVLMQHREVVNYALDGTRLTLHQQWSVFPGHEDDWSLVQVGRVDLTARKAAEARLDYLRTFDDLTGLYNRAFYTEAMARLDRERIRPVCVILLDLNGLKAVNDRFGHGAGDDLLRRAGGLLKTCVPPAFPAARIGGDEFLVLMPGVGEAEGEEMLERIRIEILAHNLSQSGSLLSLSIGLAATRPGETLAEVVHRADAAMYAAKRRHYGQQDASVCGAPFVGAAEHSVAIDRLSVPV